MIILYVNSCTSSSKELYIKKKLKQLLLQQRILTLLLKIINFQIDTKNSLLQSEWIKNIPVIRLIYIEIFKQK